MQIYSGNLYAFLALHEYILVGHGHTFSSIAGRIVMVTNINIFPEGVLFHHMMLEVISIVPMLAAYVTFVFLPFGGVRKVWCMFKLSVPFH